MTWSSFWCGITTWSEKMTWHDIVKSWDTHTNQSDLLRSHNMTTAMKTAAAGLDSHVWCFHMDLVLVVLLAMLSFAANMGLLYLARLTKPLVQINHSSFSMTGPLSPFTIPTQTSGNQNSSGVQASPTRKCSLPIRRLFCCPPTVNPSFTDQFYANLLQNSNNTTGTLRKSSSSVSISRFANSSVPNPMNIPAGNGRAPRTRRHRRYLKGLLGLSVSNLTVAFSLFLWCVCHITEHRVFLPWLALLSVGNCALADIAQSLEIGAVLWIALERTLGIHWPRERRPSSPSTDKPRIDRKSCGTRLCELICPQWCLQIRRSKFCTRSPPDSSKCTVNKCLPCLLDRPLCGRLGQNSAFRERIHRNVRFMTTIALSLLPLLLFLLAASLSVHAFLRPLLTNIQGTNFTALFFVTERMLMELQSSPSDQRILGEFRENQSLNRTQFLTITYYTNSIVSALVIGQFIAPLAILITTNLLIYRKVSARDKQFFSRQSSNTSKSSFASSTSTYVSITPITPVRKSVPGCTVIPVPLLRVLESSNQDLSTCDTQADADINNNGNIKNKYNNNGDQNNNSGSHNNSVQSELTRTERTNLLVVPDFGAANLPRRESGLDIPKSGLAVRRCSTPLLPMAGEAKSFDSILIRETDERKQLYATPQMRRKSSSDVFASIFHGRNSEPSANVRSGEEPLLLQMLRRQHHRTLRILIILLLVFVMCRAPRAIVLLIGWLQSRSLCQPTKQAYLWLHYTSLWANTSAVFDTIVYGFWGNRTYRTRLRHWYSKCVNCTKHEL
ncbi:hypothetical protein FGIG_02247 [Fasciola gigantica]|uniref:G-protein coupled receptors family 1 profile domain-containing protein n=1 Tax=Fasciola gigantica TaxID=46835 RepID=A0A504YSH7_FASGI|nr:hypothetical protein FGIG_02247 [Fasciola gigantica]